MDRRHVGQVKVANSLNAVEKMLTFLVNVAMRRRCSLGHSINTILAISYLDAMI